MSGSEHEFSNSECSNSESPRSQMESPYSSPSQQVPHLANVFSGITCDDLSMHNNGKNRPHLRIIEQPQNYFRFRYKSEMVGTHGCLLGKTTTASKNKTHPTVELVNYTGKAVIKCRLSQADKDDEHPHKLFEDEQEDRDVSTVVPEQGSYKIGFAGMGIIHTAKKDVPALLFKKYVERLPNANPKEERIQYPINNVLTLVNPNEEIRAHCDNTAKSINLNIVRLRFSAHDIVTDKELCPPAFSEPIHNMKSAAVNDLKICRISRVYGRPRGGDDVFILVEKVNKKNIMIRFYELNEHGEECWSATGNFLLSDVHHQYAIVFRTPPYKDLHISKDVKVFVELVRPSDGRTSEPKTFVYKADQLFNQSKKRRRNSPYSSIESSSSGSILSDVPVTVEMINQADRLDAMQNIPVYQIHIPQVPVAASGGGGDLADALYYGTAADQPPAAPPLATSPMLGHPTSPMLGHPASPMVQPSRSMAGQPQAPGPPIIQLNSSELERLMNDPNIPSDERKRFCEIDWTEYMQSFDESLPGSKANSMDFLRAMQLVTDSGKGKPTNSMEFFRAMHLVTDSGKGKGVVKSEPVSPSKSDDSKKANIVDKTKGNNEYNAFYKAEDGNEVKKLVKEICELIKNKSGYKKQIVRSKLEKLFDLRLSNGDTFLHMTLSSNQSSFEFIIKLIHSMKMPHLLNLTNDLQQTILHLAVLHDQPRLVAFLISKGCDPMIGDKEGNNVVHYAVICQTCLDPLLDAIKTNDVACDLNAYNHEKQTALHLAAIYDSESSARLLLKHGASYNARDSEGRTPLHLATYDDYLGVTRALLDSVLPSEIDAVDGRGNTALQIVCGANMRSNSIQIVKLLLEKKADPLKHEEHNEPAWKLAVDKPGTWEAVRPHVPPHALLAADEIKSEPEDEYESADDGDSQDCGLLELPLYVGEVSALLDASGAWEPLAKRLRMDALLSWYGNTNSPTRTLLTHLKEYGDNVTSKSLAMHLQDMGQADAANVIRRCLTD